jgi:hypothetical protein
MTRQARRGKKRTIARLNRVWRENRRLREMKRIDEEFERDYGEAREEAWQIILKECPDLSDEDAYLAVSLYMALNRKDSATHPEDWEL